MKKIFIITTILFITWNELHAKPVAGVTSISWNTSRAMTLSTITEQHTLTILKEKAEMDTIDPGIINRELSKFSCFDEKCIIPFARNAGINLIINGDIQDRDSYLQFTLKAYAVNSLYNGNLIHSYSVKIPLDTPAGAREFSLICEEQAASFISGVLSAFNQDIAIKKSDESYFADTDLKLDGKFSLYQKNKAGAPEKSGEVILKNNYITETLLDEIPAGSFIIINYKEQSASLKKYYRTRKREILFKDTSVSDTLYMALLTPFASSTMPLVSPFLGYYMNNDWSGLGLWVANATPYIYMEARGLYNSPSRLKKNKEDISRDDRAMYYFGWYMAAAGGLPLFIDSYAHTYLYRASYYSADTRLLGSNLTAAYLSLVSNGGGMFYKGHRQWGYFYFHLNNILLYATLREFSRAEEYNSESGLYIKKNSNSSAAKRLCAVLAVSKIIETVHTLITVENIDNGIVTEEFTIPEPFVSFDETNSPVYGLSVSYRF